jgi:hypothetical protein
VLITLDVTPGVAVAEELIEALDRDRDGTSSTHEREAFAARVASALRVELDGRPLTLRVVSSNAPELAAFRRGEGALRLTLRAPVAPVPAGSHRLLFRNAYLAGHSAYLANALVPESAELTVTAQHRTVDQSALTIEYTVSRASPAAPTPRSGRPRPNDAATCPPPKKSYGTLRGEGAKTTARWSANEQAN